MNELLKVLAESDGEKEAPAAVELRLRAAFRKQHSHSKWPYFAMAAAIVLAVLLLRPKPHHEQQIARIEAVKPQVEIQSAAAIAPRKVAHRKPPKREVTTDFYPLIDDPAPFEGGELLRVSLPASAMRGVGLPVSEDRLTEMVQADVLVGQEGLARAIRFVRNDY